MEEYLSRSNGSIIMDYHGGPVEIVCRRDHRNYVFSIFQGANPLDVSFTILLFSMSVILILCQIMRFLLKPLKQPKVVSDVLAGIILGPSFLGHNEKFAKYVFPENLRFIVKNIGIIGLMFFLFVTGVKMDLAVIHKATKKHWKIALNGLVIPHIITWLVACGIWNYIDPNLRHYDYIGSIISVFVITSFPAVYSILRDMHLLSSDLGRSALITVIIGDVVGISQLLLFEAVKHGSEKRINIIYYLATVIGLSSVVIVGIPKVMQWISMQTPEGKPVDQKYITTTFLGVFVIAFFSDFIGAAIGNGPLWLGLAIPDGPPLGATIVNKSEVLVNDILLPFSYALIGFKTDVFAMSKCWSCLVPIFALTTISIVSKHISVVVAARSTNMSYRDSLALSLMLSLRGQTEFFLYLYLLDLKIATTSSFSLMVILTTIITSVSTPMIHFLYDPTRPYMINKKRTIQHTIHESELRILACIYDQESMASLFSLLDFTNPTINNPFIVFSLYLIELIGRAAPMFIDHTKQFEEYWDNNNEAIHKAIKLYEQVRMGCVTMNLFTSVTPQWTMYQDICEIALINKVGFIILPFHKKCIEDGNDFSTAIIRPGVQLANVNTLFHAPCSVGILACKNVAVWRTLPTRTSHRVNRQFVMLFLGGPDAREALTLAGRMVEHPDVSLIVVRFIESEIKENNESERKLDDGVVTWFWMKNERNDKVVYKEVFVNNSFEIVSAIQLLNDSLPIDLWVIGRKNGINPILMEGLSEWSENPELGLIGDFLVSMDFNTSGSVLVVQQQVLRNQHARPWCCY